ncbi:hypothetical protein MMC07_000313 [Pseudocyphellaria aurata]|nr:hypothetical protein [Pseudocyphellaria aurata]
MALHKNTIHQKIKLLEEPSTVVQPSLSCPSTDKIQPAATQTRNTKNIVKFFPELVPALSLLPELIKTSKTIDQVATTHDPAKANLIAFGKAARKIHKSSRSEDLPIIVMTCGSAGDVLRLVLLKKEKLRWKAELGLGLRRLAFGGADQSWWSGNRGPILQVCFAETKGETSPWLAVRYHSATIILYILVLSNSVLSLPSPLSLSHPPSRLDAHHITTLCIQSTGGSPHADVSFNPWDTLQFGIVDDQGHWTLWRLKRHVPRKNSWTTNLGLSGCIAEDNGEDSESEKKNDDGWGKILWVGSGDMILVANRRMLSLFLLKEKVDRLESPKLSFSGSTDLILDVRRSPSDDNHVFVTTCTRIFWLHIPSLGEIGSDKDTELEASILLSWRHFRDQEDFSLRISVLKDDETTMVILYSRLTALSTIFSFQMSIAPPGFPLSVSDPFLLPLSHEGQEDYIPNSDCGSNKEPAITALELNTVQYDTLDDSLPPGLGSQYRKCGVKFYQLTIFNNDHSLRDGLCASQLTSDFTPIQLPRTRYASKTHSEVIGRSFIIPNRLSLENHENLIISRVSQEHKKGTTTAETVYSDEDPWTLNFEWLERKICEISPRSLAVQVSKYNPATPFDKCLELIRSAIVEKMNDSISGIETLYDTLDTYPFIDDIDTASTKLEDLVASVHRICEDRNDGTGENLKSSLRVFKTITPQLMTALDTRTQSGQEVSISQIYDGLIKSWISTLSPAVPGRVRIATEKRLRESATYLYLASFGVLLDCEISIENENKDIRQGLVPMEQQFSLPVRRKRSLPTMPAKALVSQMGRSTSPLASSQISEDTGFMPPSQALSQPLAPTLPTPEMTPSLLSQSSISSLGATAEDAASKRLRTLANLAPQPALPTSASNILRHWAESMNPDYYDWEATQNSMAAENQDQGDDEDESNAKMRKRREKRLKRQREILQVPSSQPLPTKVGESQPSPRQKPHQGSSVGVGMGGGTISQMSKGSTQGRLELGKKSGPNLHRAAWIPIELYQTPDALVLPHSQPLSGSQARDPATINAKHLSWRESIVRSPYPLGYQGQLEKAAAKAEDRTEAILTLVLYDHRTRVPRVGKVVMPVTETTGAETPNPDEQLKSTPTLRRKFDDEILFKLLRAQYSRIGRPFGTFLSVRNVRGLGFLSYTKGSQLAKQDRGAHRKTFPVDGRDGTGLLALYQRPKRGRGEYEWVE